MDSIDSNVDLELIAALIDGRLAGEDRARAMKLLANSDEALEIFAQAMREQHEVPESKVVPISASRHWRRWKVWVPVAAAAGLTIALVPRMTDRGTKAVLANEYAMELSRDPRFTSGLPEGWEQRGWRVTRGVGSFGEGGAVAQVGSRRDSSIAFRLGVRSVDLQVALSRGDSAVAMQLTDEILDALGAVSYAQPVAEAYANFKSQLGTNRLAQSIVLAADAEREMRKIVPSAPFEFGQWVGAAELAARTHDGSFFESSRGTRFIRSAEPADSVALDETQALQRIDARIQHGLTDRAFDEVDEDLRTIIRHRGG